MRGAGRLPVSAGVSPVTTCSMTISRPRAQSASSAARMAADVDGLPSSGTYRRLRPATGRMPGRTSSTGATWLLSSASATWPMPEARPGAARAAQAEGEGVHRGPADEPRERLDGVAVDGRELESLEVGAARLRHARLAHVHAAHLPAGGGRERARRRDQLLVGGGVCDGYEKRHSALHLPRSSVAAPQPVTAGTELPLLPVQLQGDRRLLDGYTHVDAVLSGAEVEAAGARRGSAAAGGPASRPPAAAGPAAAPRRGA